MISHMAFPARRLHSAALAVVGMCLITYSSYYASSSSPDPGRIFMVSQIVTSSETVSSLDTQTTFSSMLLSNSTTPHAAAAVSASSTHSNNITINHIVFEVVQKIPPKQPIESSVLSTISNNSDCTEQGILTRYIHESGYDIPNVELCPELGKNMQLLVGVTSAPGHNEARMAIRQTWGHYRQRNDVNIAFLVGSTSDKHMSHRLHEENKLYGDLILAHFLDSYNNLTLKTVSMLEWVDNYCNHVNFILKTDDDMFINVPKLLNFIEKHAKEKKKIFGRLAKKWKPIRNKKSKYYVSPNQYQPAVFPDFTTGPAYLMTGDVVHELYTAALGKTYLKLEDVFITGIVAQDTKIKRTHVNEFLNKRVTFNACNIQKGISIHMVKPPEQFDLWKKLLDGKSKCK